MITVEKNIPVPEAPEQPTKTVYPWDVMQVGDSFLVPNEEGRTPRQLMQRVGASASRHADKNGRKYVLRVVPEGIRAWRVEDPPKVEAYIPPPPPPPDNTKEKR